ncbi:MAG TPA: DUF4874 domain-containing protein, partial [Mariniphaga anaerophila]|nr:DUF4874 domain-containing protein [Mariniphaga anaerophila]
MRKQRFLFKFFLLLISGIFASGVNNLYSQKVNGDRTKYTYTESMEDFPNPERGFYRYSETRSGDYVTLKPEELRAYRSENRIRGADYSVYSTLVFRYFVMSDFVESDLSEAFLDSVSMDFRAAREGGVKL